MRREPLQSRRAPRRPTSMPGGSDARCGGPVRCEFPERDRMNRWQLLGVGLTLVTAVNAGAQTANSCAAGSTINVNNGQILPDRQKASQDACQMAVDVFQLLSPQLG